MKRKIAILLSAMMVTSAVPFSVNAAQLKSDSILNTASAKAGETIDPAASKYSESGEFNTADKLRGRQSVLKINLNDDNTDMIPAGTSFYVDLENGTFPENSTDFQNMFRYRNIDGTGKKVDETAVSGAKTLTQVWEILSNKTSTAIQDAESVLTAKAVEVKGSNTDNYSGFISAMQSTVDEELEKLVGTTPELLHIPYTVNYVSPTRIEVKTMVDMTNSDKKITSIGSAKTVADLKVTYYAGSVAITEGNYDDNDENIDKVVISLVGDNATLENPYIALPLGGVIADGNGAVKAKVDAGYTNKVVGGEYTITQGLEGGSTTLVYDEKNVKSFEDYVTLETVTIRENVRDTLGKSNKKDEAEITLRVGGGFKFKNNVTVNNDGTSNTAKVVLEGSSSKITISDISNPNESTIKFKVSGLGTGRTSRIGLAIQGLQIEASNDKNYGDVELSVSGDGISGQTVKVAKREQLGFKLETTKDAQDIISGRHYANTNNASMVEADNTTVEVKFSEAVPNTLVTTRALDFNVPDGVKIVDATIENKKNINAEDNDFEIINNGKTLRLKRNSKVTSGTGDVYDVTGDRSKVLASFTMKLNLSVDPSFTGDVKLSVVGGGQAEGTTPDVVVAKAKAPFEIKTQTTKVDLGYQDYNTADISIVETKPGMFLEGETATLNLVAPYGVGEVGFSAATFEVTGGELNIKEKDFKVSNGQISFKVDRASYKNPSTMTIKNVKIGSTRSVPFGSYSLAIGGKAVINNYAEENDKNVTVAYDKTVSLDTALTDTAAATGLHYQNNEEYYEVKDYVNVVTATGTFNETVKVTVGEKTVLVGDQAIDMDVAPYIQASSNSTMVPLRFVSVALGVDSENVTNPDASNKIAWDANTKTTTIYYGAGTGQKIIQFQAGSNIMTVDGTRIPMEYGVKAEIKDGRMFVPFRALGQALGVTVTWDADTRTAIYNESNARNTNSTTTTATTTATTTETTTVSGSTTESTTESTTASTDSTTETTTAKQ